jgi:hypothetical protein
VRIFGPKKEVVAGQVKSRMMRWAGHVARMGNTVNEKKNTFLEWLKGRDHLEDLGIDERIILKWILKKGCSGKRRDVDWTQLALMSTAMNFQLHKRQ